MLGDMRELGSYTAEGHELGGRRAAEREARRIAALPADPVAPARPALPAAAAAILERARARAAERSKP